MKTCLQVAQGCKADPATPLIDRQRLFDVHIHVGLQNEEFHGAQPCAASALRCIRLSCC